MYSAAADLVRRIEAASAASLAGIARALDQCGHQPLMPSLGGGVALCLQQGSNLNKLVGLGFEPLDLEALVEFERGASLRRCQLQAELSTHADPACMRSLLARGYNLHCFDNVFARALHEEAAPVLPAGLELRIPRVDESAVFVDVISTGFDHPDESAAPTAPAQRPRSANDRVFADLASTRAVEPWLAQCDGELAGGANMRVQDGVALFFGASTLPRKRRRGVQATLLRARLHDAWQRGCDIATVTTGLGSISQQNVERAGFALLYQRAVLRRDP